MLDRHLDWPCHIPWEHQPKVVSISTANFQSTSLVVCLGQARHVQGRHMLSGRRTFLRFSAQRQRRRDTGAAMLFL